MGVGKRSKEAIGLTKDTKARFKSYGVYGETADIILNRLMDHFDQTGGVIPGLRQSMAASHRKYD